MIFWLAKVARKSEKVKPKKVTPPEKTKEWNTLRWYSEEMRRLTKFCTPTKICLSPKGET
jgi:hypothetical protein